MRMLQLCTSNKDGAFYLNYVCQAVDMDEDVETITKSKDGAFLYKLCLLGCGYG